MQRILLLALAIASAAGCSAPTPVDPVVVTASHNENGCEILVDNESVQLADLNARVLSQAMANNPGTTAEEVRAQERIYFTGYCPDALRIIETLNREFAKVGILGSTVE